MEVGDCVPVASVRVIHPTGWMDYKAPDGKVFVLCLMGVQDKAPDGDKLDCLAVFRELGWEAVSEQAGS